MEDVHSLARLGVHLMSILDSGVTIQNAEESSLVVEVKENQDRDPILLESRVQSIIREWRFSPKREMVYFATRADCAFLMWAS